ncbi:hypothetical protein OG394_03665 [Kribbella sp. NBC_01245]|uniref:DoxX family protein n=1 Tax=Kribbella sp. NBC_01245 TaxID=2903578 RepID=UPI002E28A0A5|nr:DoxX family protein [Kribbella sp. NBC_01245]
MFALAVVVTVLLLLEVVPSAATQLPRLGVALARLDELTRLGVLQGRNLWVVTLLGSLHTVGAVAVIIGLWTPLVGVIGAAIETLIFGWTLDRQLRAGDRGRALLAYSIFTTSALAVLAVDLLRVG